MREGKRRGNLQMNEPINPPPPTSTTLTAPSHSWTPQMCVCTADKRWKTNWSTTTPLITFGRKEKRKKMAFTCCNYWRAAGPDWLVSFVSAAHRGPVEKLPPELGGGGGEVMDCSLLVSRTPQLFVPFLSLLQRGRRVLGCQAEFFFLGGGGRDGRGWNEKWKIRKTACLSVPIESKVKKANSIRFFIYRIALNCFCTAFCFDPGTSIMLLHLWKNNTKSIKLFFFF